MGGLGASMTSRTDYRPFWAWLRRPRNAVLFGVAALTVVGIAFPVGIGLGRWMLSIGASPSAMVAIVVCSWAGWMAYREGRPRIALAVVATGFLVAVGDSIGWLP